MNFSRTPKTPGRSKSMSKAPLTPSFMAELNSLSISSPTKPRRGGGMHVGVADISNPFLVKNSGYGHSKSRSNSPIKRATGRAGKFDVISAELKRQASMGVVRKGGPESRMDVITLDRNLPRPADMKRSRSQPAVKREKVFPREPNTIPISKADRFISARDDLENIALGPMTTSNSSPGHIMRLAEATGIAYNKRVLAFHEAPPPPSADTLLAPQRAAVGPLLQRSHGHGLGSSHNPSKARKIRTSPERVLDAPDMVDDYYLNLVDWSAANVVAVGLASSTYIWRADRGEVSHVTDAPENSYISSVKFTNDGDYLAVAFGTGAIELWDINANRKLRTILGRQAQVAAMSWHEHLLSSGCQDGGIWHHDVRVANHKVMELQGHNGEVCGLAWRADGEMLASGGNDNVVNIWDNRVGDVTPESRGAAKWTKRNHTAAVKAVAWCPWQPTLVATGGGTGDATVNFWNATTGARISTVKTPSQVTSIRFCPHKKEFVTTHGGPVNSIMVHAYPSMETVADIREAHDARVLYSALSPNGEMVVTAAADENLKFWKIWDAAPKRRPEKGKGMMSDAAIMSLR